MTDLLGNPTPAVRRIMGYARNTLRQIDRFAPEAGEFVAWAANSKALLNLDLNSSDDDDEWSARRKEPTLATWKAVQAAFAAHDEMHEVQANPCIEVVGRLAVELGFDSTDTSILHLLVDYVSNPTVEQLWDCLATGQGRPTRLSADTNIVALLTGIAPSEVAKRLSIKANLRMSGLVHVDPDRDVRLHARLRQLAAEQSEEFADIRAAMFGRAAPAQLSFADFAHLGRDAELVLALLRGALSSREPGIHILLYGPPGTGKTELAKTLAATIGVPLFSVGEQDEHGGEPSRHERLSNLLLAQRLFAGGNPAVLLLDEATDLFAGHGNRTLRERIMASQDPFATAGSGGSQAFMHRMLESGPVPVIWTSNSLDAFGAAVLRRMACCVEVAIPPTSVRAALWAKAAQEEGLTMPTGDINRLARLLPAAPALAQSAMRAARLAGGNLEAVKWAVTGVARAMNNGRLPPSEAEPASFDPSLVSADVDLAALADRLAKPGASRAFSLLASGPPGSGKSAFARYLASRMGLEPVQKRASDLYNAYVGETEKRIAAAFREAADNNAFLIFDEADSLLAPRTGAVRNWEVSQVNEMLTWMEHHPLPFCCTTNLIDRVDDAAMRRFLVKAQFGYLRPAQVEMAWRRTFAPEPPAGLATLDRLTPADFDVVRKGAELYGALDDAVALLRALRREQTAKTGGAGTAIGFQITH